MTAIAGRSDGGRSCHHTAGGIGAAVAVGTGAGNGSSATGAVVGAGAKHHHATRYVVASPLIVHSRSARPSTFHRGPRRAGRALLANLSTIGAVLVDHHGDVELIGPLEVAPDA